MQTVISKDGTRIAYDQYGTGLPLILVTGALGTRTKTAEGQLAGILDKDFAVIDYDRRGRGDSSDTQPYAVEREIEDIQALIDALGGEAYLFGMSSGAVLALEAAAKLSDKVKKLAMYEPPFIIDDSRPPLPADYVEQLNKATAEGRRSDAVEIFMTRALLIPAEFVQMMKNAPMAETFSEGVKPPEWSDMEKVAHTLAYDGIIVRDYLAGKPLPEGHWSAYKAPGLVIVGENSEPFFHDAAKALANDMPNVKVRILEGQDHAVSPAALGPVLAEFFCA